MEIDSWFKWLMVYLYEIGAVLLLVSSIVFALKFKNAFSYIAVLGFCAFIVGNQVQKSAQNAIVEAAQTRSSSAAAEKHFHVGRAFSSFGFFIGTVSLLGVAFRSRKPNESGLNL